MVQSSYLQLPRPHMPITPFAIHITPDALHDLRLRLQSTRWPDEIDQAGWSYGANLGYMKELVRHWSHDFSWEKQENRLNSYPQYQTTIDGLKIHFIHAKGKSPKTIPLLMTHGWPSSFTEMLKIIPMLTEPKKFGYDTEYSFDVIVPSLPGFGFSERPHQSGCTVPMIATLWMKLMTEALGYSRFAAHGSDWGTSITAALGFFYPTHVIGIHQTSVTGGTPSHAYPETPPLSQEEAEYLHGREEWWNQHGAYSHILSTTPQTYGYGLNDSPVGLASLLVEKFRDWSDCNGNVETRFTKDEMLTNISIYWFTQTITSSMRIYYENQRNPWLISPQSRVQVPCAIAKFPKEMSKPCREWGNRFYPIVRWTEFQSGGHFPASEEPALLAQDLLQFFHGI